MERTPPAPTSNAKRRCTDPTDCDPSDLLNIRTRTLPGNLNNIAGDPTKYKAIIVPIELAPLFEKLCQTLLDQLTHDKNKNKDNNNDVEPDDDVFIEPNIDEDLRTTFLNDFGSARRLYENALRQADEKSLVDDVPPELYDTFRHTRKVLTKWFVTGAHLHNKLTGNRDSNKDKNKYLRMAFDYSIAVTDSHLLDKCTNKILDTEKLIENSLTSSMLDKAILLISEVNTLWRDTPKKIFLKAFRVVSKANSHLLHTQLQHLPKHNNNKRRQHRDSERHTGPARRDPYKKYDWNARRPRLQSNKNKFNSRKESRRDSDEDYPPLRRNNNNYRRYKRHNSDESEEEEYHRRPFRSHKHTNHRRQTYRDYSD